MASQGKGPQDGKLLVASALPLTGPLRVTSQPSADRKPSRGLGCTAPLHVPARVAHICSAHLASLTDQLLAPNQKGQVGVLGRGRKERRITHSCSRQRMRRREAVRMKLGGVLPRAGAAGQEVHRSGRPCLNHPQRQVKPRQLSAYKALVPCCASCALRGSFLLPPTLSLVGVPD